MAKLYTGEPEVDVEFDLRGVGAAFIDKVRPALRLGFLTTAEIDRCDELRRVIDRLLYCHVS